MQDGVRAAQVAAGSVPARPTHRVSGLTPAQERALLCVQESPGCSIQAVAVAMRSSHATAAYHLYALARAGLLVQVRDGREVRHFAGKAAPGSAEYVEALRRDPRKAKLLAVLASERPGVLSIHQMSKLAGLTFSVTKRTLQQLEGAGVIALERRRYRYVVRIQDGVRELLAPQQADAAFGRM